MPMIIPSAVNRRREGIVPVSTLLLLYLSSYNFQVSQIIHAVNKPINLTSIRQLFNTNHCHLCLDASESWLAKSFPNPVKRSPAHRLSWDLQSKLEFTYTSQDTLTMYYVQPSD